MLDVIQVIAIVLALAAAVVTAYLVVTAVRNMLGVIRLGQPAVGRTDNPANRSLTMLKETFGHTRMFQWRWVGVMHWFVYFGFLILASAVATGVVQLFDPRWQIPIIGHWFVYEWVSEFIGVLSTIGIIYLIVYRQFHKPAQLGRRSRFFGSTFWQAYFVEFMALLEGVAILFIRGAERNLEIVDGNSDRAGAFHYPVAQLFSGLYSSTSRNAIETAIIVIAFVKVVSALIWLGVVASNLTMGIAWHRFTAWPNIWFKRESKGRETDGATTALGAMKPLISGGKPITLDDLDDLDDDARLGAGTIADFSWKGILDFTTCTECGRCQSQCPAWNTAKPLSPKHVVMSLRDHAYAAAPYLDGHGRGSTAADADGTGQAEAATALLDRPLIGKTDKDSSVGSSDEVLDWFYNPPVADGEAGFVMDEDVLWACTSCGACVQQCPVDIEHVDHIMDMRRYQVLVESNFPTELNGLFKGLENKGNPWNMSASARLDWAKDLPFDVKVVGEDLESLDEVDWLFWVGCAGAYEDRAKKTTRAVAELLDMAGVSFGVLGNGETCTGDPARRAGNEFVFQGLAAQNVETFKEYKVKKAVTTCAHCFNTLRNEYKELGIELEVVHHTQLLNRLVREGRLTPVADGAGAHKRSITYHDPCYIGRHNGVYTPPRELLQVLPGAEYVEMPRNSERSFCCGAGGARMWMEERIGQRINRNRTDEAVATGADQIAVGCPFCRVMLSDGLTAAQAEGSARESVEVLDVAQMLLASVKGEQATKLAPGQGSETAAKVATAAEPSPGDVTASAATLTETAETGAAAKAHQEAPSGSSLFDDAGSLFDSPAAAPSPSPAAPTPAAPTPAAEAVEAPAKAAGGSLFDEGASLFDAPAPAPAEPAEAPAEPAEASEAPRQASGTSAETPAVDLSSGGSLFDIPAATAEPVEAPAEPVDATAEPVEASTEPVEAPAEPVKQVAEPSPTEPASPTVDLNAGGSLFDIPAPTADAPTAVEPVDVPEAPRQAPETSADAAAAPEPVAEPVAEPGAPAAGSSTPQPRTDVDIEGFSSLFDIEAPQGATASTAPASTASDLAAEAVAPVAEPSVEEEQPVAVPSQLAAEAVAPVAEPVIDDEDEGGSADDVTSANGSGSASEGVHTPRTDADIASAGSLFDL